MMDNYDVVKLRLESYTASPDRAFRVETDYPVAEKDIQQKVGQYWADKSISNEERLAGFEYDLSNFDPENTSNVEMRAIAWELCDLGVIDTATASWLGGLDVEFNSQGNEINKGKKKNVFTSFNSSLEYYKTEISAGNTSLKNVQRSLSAALLVVLAIQERAQMTKNKALIDTHA
ncbi:MULTISPECIES: hypothetical protein [unclassified Pseudomonas]|uniref:hypothetical protein n=1 Tax=unclassified Pseudomonas TaxID=196821 RepID=UPI002B22B716|nr:MULTISPECIES: hypothetical protein [unclassified Pseudomonas]MEA9979949.1 hypothetical protein [Pseudomonas sp. RTS4]MEB0199413.1 hypothetical protein [Pseudomonas sp. 5S4]MEB0246503.1 hypothetical protein [Pseudomonas sp. 10S5]